MPANSPVRLFDIVTPGSTNHHGTLFGGIGLAHMDKVAFIAAARFGRADFVTASCERIDFAAPCRLGDIVTVEGRVVRRGRRSLGVAVKLLAEAPLTGEVRHCGGGLFSMVALGEPAPVFPTLVEGVVEPEGELRMVDLVLPGLTGQGGRMAAGRSIDAMARAAWIAATRATRQALQLAESRDVVLEQPIAPGEVMELVPRLEGCAGGACWVAVELRAEDVLSGVQRRCGGGRFRMSAAAALAPAGAVAA